MTKPRISFDMNIMMVSLLALNALLGIYIAFLKPDAYALETLKVWGRENMKMAKQLYSSDTYKQEQKSTLQQILGSMGQAAPTEEVAAPTLDASRLDAIKANTYVKGNTDARITIVEYSDLLCPFCKRHYNAQTLENLVAKYPNDVNMIFKQMPLPQLHPTAPLWAQATLCAGKIGGSEAFYEYLAEAFQFEEFTQDNVVELAQKVGINKSKFTSCLTSEETIAQVNAEVQEGNGFGITGTPGNLVIDNEKWTYTVIAGAYPTETFEAEITKILGK